MSVLDGTQRDVISEALSSVESALIAERVRLLFIIDGTTGASEAERKIARDLAATYGTMMDSVRAQQLQMWSIEQNLKRPTLIQDVEAHLAL